MTMTFLVLFLGLFSSADSGCEIKSCNMNYSQACITEQQSDQIDNYCGNHSCGACAVDTPIDDCYREYGYCRKTASGCGWERSNDLNNCIKATYKRPSNRAPLGQMLQNMNVQPLHLRPNSGN